MATLYDGADEAAQPTQFARQEIFEPVLYSAGVSGIARRDGSINGASHANGAQFGGYKQ